MGFDCIKCVKSPVKCMCHGMIFSAQPGTCADETISVAHPGQKKILAGIKQCLDSLTLRILLKSFFVSPAVSVTSQITRHIPRLQQFPAVFLLLQSGVQARKRQAIGKPPAWPWLPHPPHWSRARGVCSCSPCSSPTSCPGLAAPASSRPQTVGGTRHPGPSCRSCMPHVQFGDGLFKWDGICRG